VFAAFSEEIGFFGNMVLLSLYFYLAYYFLTHLRYVKDDYSKVIGVGIISLIMIQVFVNI
jgi:cell division protein FtsW (lipid II flippase)